MFFILLMLVKLMLLNCTNNVQKQGDFSDLKKAIMADDIQRFNQLFDPNNIDQKDSNGDMLIHIAIKRYMDQENNPNVTREQSRGKPVEILISLIENGAKLGVVDSVGKNVMDYANGNKQLLSVILDIAISLGKVGVSALISRSNDGDEVKNFLDRQYKLSSGSLESLSSLATKHNLEISTK